MAAYDVKVTSKGQVTLPVEIRRMWNLKAGEKVAFYVDPLNREVVLGRRNLPASAVWEVVPPRERLPDVKDDEDAIAKAVVERNLRGRSKAAAE